MRRELLPPPAGGDSFRFASLSTSLEEGGRVDALLPLRFAQHLPRRGRSAVDKKAILLEEEGRLWTKPNDGIGLPIAMCMEREKLWGENMKKKIGRFLKIFAFCALLAVMVSPLFR